MCRQRNNRKLKMAKKKIVCMQKCGESGKLKETRGKRGENTQHNIILPLAEALTRKIMTRRRPRLSQRRSEKEEAIETRMSRDPIIAPKCDFVRGVEGCLGTVPQQILNVSSR